MLSNKWKGYFIFFVGTVQKDNIGSHANIPQMAPRISITVIVINADLISFSMAEY